MTLEKSQALDAFAALSQETRLRMLGVLVRAAPEGLPAGSVANAVDASASSASFHLAHLERAGLVQSHRASRSIIYRANYEAISGLIGFLLRDCCSGRPEICVPAAATAAACAAASGGETACAC